MDLRSAAQPLSPEIDFLYNLRRGSTRLGLASTRRLLRSLGNPELGVPMLHVAGTNGKGSTTALAAAMLQAGGLRVGRFTSPHLLRVEERVCVDGEPVASDDFLRRVRELQPFFERAGVSFFEAMTALAALHFRDAGCDVAVYEVGLGGRLDSTNALRSDVSVITSIGHDHEAILGRGLRAVCREKLGIVRRGVPLFAGLERPDLVRLARQHCVARRAPCAMLPPDYGRVLELDLVRGMRFELRVPRRLQLATRLLGAHQVRNAALAALAVFEMRRREIVTRDPDVAAGAWRAFIAGRFQVLSGEPPVVLDVGHNPEALQTTLDLFEQLFPEERPIVVLGMLRDKRLGEAAGRIERLARRILLTAPQVERAWNPNTAKNQFARPVELYENVAAAIESAIRDSTAPVLVLGSHYLLGEAILKLAELRNIDPEELMKPPSEHATRAVG